MKLEATRRKFFGFMGASPLAAKKRRNKIALKKLLGFDWPW